MYRAILLLLVLIVSAPATAAKNDTGYGYLGSALWTTVDDPDGKGDSQSAVAPLGLFYAFEGGRDLRYHVALSYLSGQVDNGAGTVNQDFTSLILGAALQTRWRFARTWKPWVGAGITVLDSEFTDRFVTDKDGFLLARYADRSETGYAVTLTASQYWDIGRTVRVGLEALADIPISTDLRRLGVGVSVLF